MTWTEAERDQMRTLHGFPRLYISANPFFESAMTSVLPISEGGSAPDASIENAIRAALVQITAIDGYINNVETQVINFAVYEVPVSLSNGSILKQDYRQTLAMLRREGTNQIMKISIRLGVQPLRPYYYSDGLGAGSAYANPKFFSRK